MSQVVGVKPPPLEIQDNSIPDQNQDEEIQTQEVNEAQPEPVSLEAKVSVDLSKAFRRNFKILGIGGGNHKDGLSFVSLARQIDTGIKSGYKETELIEAVIRSVNSSLKLGSYLEMMSGLT